LREIPWIIALLCPGRGLGGIIFIRVGIGAEYIYPKQDNSENNENYVPHFRCLLSMRYIYCIRMSRKKGYLGLFVRILR
jgi:hypothetical protein